MADSFAYDIFLSHASEDKASFVEPLAIALRVYGVRVWFDKFSLKVGDSLREKIDEGLANSHWGAVILSHSFFAKNWSRLELNGLFSIHAGRKVLLPIWHDIRAEEVKQYSPLISDIVALRSSDGVHAVARSLVELIRPDLLNVDNARANASGAGVNFIQQASEKYPGYTFGVSHFEEPGPPPPQDPKSVGYVDKDGTRIHIRVKDPEKILQRPSIQLTVTPEGSRKLEDLVATGKAQTLTAEELVKFKSNIPFFDPALTDGAILSVGPGTLYKAERWVEVVIGRGNESVKYPLLNLRIVRQGVEEAEFEISGKDIPIKFSIIFRPDDSSSITVNATFEPSGFSFTQCCKALDAWSLLLAGANVRMTDLVSESVFVDSTSLLIPESFADDLTEGLKRFISLLAQIEAKFNVRFSFGVEPDAHDNDTLFVLDCLLNDKNYNVDGVASASIVRVEGITVDQLRLAAPQEVRNFREVQAFSGTITLFGVDMPIAKWGLGTIFMMDSYESFIERYFAAPIGATIPVKYSAPLGTKVCYESDFMGTADEV